jgi:Bacterial extracellular solute-binding protein
MSNIACPTPPTNLPPYLQSKFDLLQRELGILRQKLATAQAGYDNAVDLLNNAEGSGQGLISPPKGRLIPSRVDSWESFPAVKKLILALVYWGVCIPAFGFTNGELLVWMDANRTHTLEPVLKNFDDKYGINVRLQAPQNITDNFPTAAQSGGGPDIVIWAHDKVGEWANAGLISPIEVSSETRAKYLPQAWEAVTQ